jgi:hypothetical protein
MPRAPFLGHDSLFVRRAPLLIGHDRLPHCRRGEQSQRDDT